MTLLLRLKWHLVIALACGFALGSLSSAQASASYSFAGYNYNGTYRGASAQIPYKNPAVPAGHSAEWSMAQDGSSHYIQSGWIKLSGDSLPWYFTEYSGCTPYCRTRYAQIDANTHEYKVEYFPPGVMATNDVWCAKIDGVNKVCTGASFIPLGQAPILTYSGETSDTTADMGGNTSSHLRMTVISLKNTSNTWLQVNTNSLANITTAGTRYRAAKGFSGTTYIENWTN